MPPPSPLHDTVAFSPSRRHTGTPPPHRLRLRVWPKQGSAPSSGQSGRGASWGPPLPNGLPWQGAAQAGALEMSRGAPSSTHAPCPPRPTQSFHRKPGTPRRKRRGRVREGRGHVATPPPDEGEARPRRRFQHQPGLTGAPLFGWTQPMIGAVSSSPPPPS